MNPTEDTPTHEADCPYLYGHNCSCLGKQDTPTPDHYTEASFREPFEQDDTHDPLKHYTDKAAEDYGKFKDAEVMEAMLPKQDDRQLREAIDQAIQDHLIIGVDSGQAYFHETDFAIDAILALFTTAQIQLVSELEGKLPKPTAIWHEDEVRILEQLTEILEHKKQELERGK